MNDKFVIAVSFDNTIATPDYDLVPGADKWMNYYYQLGIYQILWTVRGGESLKKAESFCDKSRIKLWSVNERPRQWSWTDSKKAAADIYVDSRAIGCPMTVFNGHAVVDWDIVGPIVRARWENAVGETCER